MKEQTEKTVRLAVDIACSSMMEDGTCWQMQGFDSPCGGKCCMMCSVEKMQKCDEVCTDIGMIMYLITNEVPRMTIKDFKGEFLDDSQDS